MRVRAEVCAGRVVGGVVVRRVRCAIDTRDSGFGDAVDGGGKAAEEGVGLPGTGVCVVISIVLCIEETALCAAAAAAARPASIVRVSERGRTSPRSRRARRL